MSEAEDSTSRKRVAWIDSAKGIAIILVVIGHVVGGTQEDMKFLNIRRL